MTKAVKILTPSAMNPFLCYAVIWSAAIIGYFFSPSQLNQPLDVGGGGILTFLTGTIMTACIAARSFNEIMRGRTFRVTYQRTSNLTLCVLFCMAVFFHLYSGNIPLISSLKFGGKGDGAYENFTRGQIGTITPLFSTYISFLAIKSGLQYSVFGQKRDLRILLAITAELLLAFTRSGLILIWLTVISVSIAMKRISVKSFLIWLMIFIAGAYAFGILGNIRCGRDWNDSSVIMRIARIPGSGHDIFSPFYWAYEYMISPLRNLIFNVNKTQPTYDLLLLLKGAIIPDLIAKRIFPGMKANVNLVTPVLNVSTCYAASWGAFGYAGMITSVLAYWGVAGLVFFLPDSTHVYKLGMISSLCTIFVFSVFSNSLLYSGWSAVIVWGMIIITKRNLLRRNVYNDGKIPGGNHYVSKKIHGTSIRPHDVM